MNDHFYKDLEVMKKNQREILEIRNTTESHTRKHDRSEREYQDLRTRSV